MSDSKHPWYGPCDALGPNGACSECYKMTPTDREIARLQNIVRDDPKPELKAAYEAAAGRIKLLVDSHEDDLVYLGSIVKDEMQPLLDAKDKEIERLTALEDSLKKYAVKQDNWNDELQAEIAKLRAERDAIRKAAQEIVNASKYAPMPIWTRREIQKLDAALHTSEAGEGGKKDA